MCLSVCMCVCVCECKSLWKPEENTRFLRVGAIGGLSCLNWGVWMENDWTWGLRKSGKHCEHRVMLQPPRLHSLGRIFNNNNNNNNNNIIFLWLGAETFSGKVELFQENTWNAVLWDSLWLSLWIDLTKQKESGRYSALECTIDWYLGRMRGTIQEAEFPSGIEYSRNGIGHVQSPERRLWATTGYAT